MRWLAHADDSRARVNPKGGLALFSAPPLPMERLLADISNISLQDDALLRSPGQPKRARAFLETRDTAQPSFELAEAAAPEVNNARSHFSPHSVSGAGTGWNVSYLHSWTQASRYHSRPW